ncbi:hypothetical protein SAMN05216219_0392 [Mycetocola miduiensis]|uniref:Uncharacterized protein n=1 Tax=Mycetocola miduiensis TaxID=995034 RepID=A0A1I4YNZ5_9MICO|nr:hypothetical protein SAMN05216219_0392 [Mycetocola miduiensis]
MGALGIVCPRSIGDYCAPEAEPVPPGFPRETAITVAAPPSRNLSASKLIGFDHSSFETVGAAMVAVPYGERLPDNLDTRSNTRDQSRF